MCIDARRDRPARVLADSGARKVQPCAAGEGKLTL
jgi:hypothetical protein